MNKQQNYSEINYSTLYRKQCEEHQTTYEKMRKYQIEVKTLRQLLISEQSAHESLKIKIKQMLSELLNEARGV